MSSFSCLKQTHIFFSVFEIEDRIRTPKKFRFPSFEAVNWLAAQKLKNDLSDLNSDSTLCPSHLLGGIKALSQTLRSWLQNLDSRPCPSSIDPHKLVRELGKEVRLAERISNKCNPPKPERESKRKKQKKELNEDFVDISHGNAFFFLGGRISAKKKPAASKANVANSKSISDLKPDHVQVLEPVPDAGVQVLKPVKVSVKKPPKKRPVKVPLEENSSPKQLKLKLPTRPLPRSALTSEMGLLESPPPPGATSAYDLTNQVRFYNYQNLLTLLFYNTEGRKMQTDFNVITYPYMS